MTLNGFFFLSLSIFFLYWERLSCSLKLIHCLHWCAIYKCIVLISICPENCMLVSVTTYNAGSIGVPCTHNHWRTRNERRENYEFSWQDDCRGVTWPSLYLITPTFSYFRYITFKVVITFTALITCTKVICLIHLRARKQGFTYQLPILNKNC